MTAGSRVKAGDSLFRFYSREVATAASEYANVVSGGGDTAGSALRLRNLGMSDRAIETIRRDRKVPPSMSFDAPADGIIIERATTPGSMAEPGDILFRIADTREMWIVADVPESQLGAVAVGAASTVTVTARPGMAVRGTVELVEPKSAIRPGLPRCGSGCRMQMGCFSRTCLEPSRYRPVSRIPSSRFPTTRSSTPEAGEWCSSTRARGGSNHATSRVGVRGAQRTEVTVGLAAGDRVVVSANFLIDAESNLNSALSALAAGDEQP